MSVGISSRWNGHIIFICILTRIVYCSRKWLSLQFVELSKGILIPLYELVMNNVWFLVIKFANVEFITTTLRRFHFKTKIAIVQKDSGSKITNSNTKHAVPIDFSICTCVNILKIQLAQKVSENMFYFTKLRN